MLPELTALVSDSEAYVCTWRNGELYIEPAPPQATTPLRARTASLTHPMRGAIAATTATTSA